MLLMIRIKEIQRNLEPGKEKVHTNKRRMNCLWNFCDEMQWNTLTEGSKEIKNKKEFRTSSDVKIHKCELQRMPRQKDSRFIRISAFVTGRKE